VQCDLIEALSAKCRKQREGDVVGGASAAETLFGQCYKRLIITVEREDGAHKRPHTRPADTIYGNIRLLQCFENAKFGESSSAAASENQVDGTTRDNARQASEIGFPALANVMVLLRRNFINPTDGSAVPPPLPGVRHEQVYARHQVTIDSSAVVSEIVTP